MNSSKTIANFSPDQKIMDDREVQMLGIKHLCLKIMVSSPMGKNMHHYTPFSFTELIKIPVNVNDIIMWII